MGGVITLVQGSIPMHFQNRSCRHKKCHNNRFFTTKFASKLAEIFFDCTISLSVTFYQP